MGSGGAPASGPVLRVVFYRTADGAEPVRDWLRALDVAARRSIGVDLKTVQFAWPLGLPLVRKMQPGLWELRSMLPAGITRVLFTVCGDRIVLLHAFVKQSRKTPAADLATARRWLAMLRQESG